LKIQRYDMEDWLNDSFDKKYNLAASGSQDFYLKEFLELCNAPLDEFNSLFLGDNDTRGSSKLRNEIVKSYRQVNFDQVLVCNGTSEALFILFNQLLAPGDEVVIPFPAFQCLYQVPVSIGCRVKFLNLLECKGWRLDLDRLDRLVTPATKMIIVNNPHNPMGWTLTPEELVRLGEIARKNDCHLLFDEHYRYLPLPPGTELVPSGYCTCKAITGKVVATGSMIKCFGTPGLRIGWLIGEPSLLAGCRDYKDYLTHTVPAITDHIAYLALKNKDAIIRLKKSHLLKNRDLLNDFMAAHGDLFEYVEPSGGVVCFPGLKKQQDSRHFCRQLIARYSVSLLPGFAFGVENHFRINFGVDSDLFKNALALIREHIDRIEE
jgi:aspartate/methionine/tyrosine aminotransferase